jgi:CheY-like chemotaxis protein
VDLLVSVPSGSDDHSGKNSAAFDKFFLLEQVMPQEKTILLVDDNAVQAAVRQVILRRFGYSVITALNPERALEQLRGNEFHSEIHLVVTDHIMPGMIGTEFVRQIRTFSPTLPVLVISGLEEAQQEYANLNVEFRVKPLAPEKLLETVGALLAIPASENELPSLLIAARAPSPAR